MLSTVAASLATAPSRAPPLCYRAPRLPAGSVLTIDGDLDKAVWDAAPWSSPFADIRGPDAPADSQPSAACATRMKMLWDDEYLYVGAIIESDFEVVASFTERNSPIYQKDSDFECFVDAAGSCHSYKEVEVSPKNVVWNLLLTRPYADGGGEHSGRVASPGAPDHYDVSAQRTATRILRGDIGAASGATWAVEMALAHDDTLARQPGGRRPALGSRWRINFSRVERCGETNWVWSPQVVWEPSLGRYEGKVNMHLPDAWGNVEFVGAADGALGQTDAAAAAVAAEPAAVAADAAMVGYYAMHAFRRQADGGEGGGGARYARDVAELQSLRLLDEVAISLCELRVESSAGEGAEGGGDSFVVYATHRASGVTVSVNHERLVRLAP